MADHPDELLAFWFSEAIQPHWFNSTPALDREIGERFAALWERALAGQLDHWMTRAEGCLALVILLDQFPLNMYRGRPESFSGEAQARTVAEVAIRRGFDGELDGAGRSFLYMPYMHSENREDQARSVALYEAAGLQENLKFARHHQGIVERFGRFPHRNAILGRVSTPDELAWLASDEAFTG